MLLKYKFMNNPLVREGCFSPLAFFFAFPMHSFKLAQTTYMQGKFVLRWWEPTALHSFSSCNIYPILPEHVSLESWKWGEQRWHWFCFLIISTHAKKTLRRAGFAPGLPKDAFLSSNLVSKTVSSSQCIHKYYHVKTLSSLQTTEPFRPAVFICCPWFETVTRTADNNCWALAFIVLYRDQLRNEGRLHLCDWSLLVLTLMSSSQGLGTWAFPPKSGMLLAFQWHTLHSPPDIPHCSLPEGLLHGCASCTAWISSLGNIITKS